MKKPKPAIKPEIKWAIWNPEIGFINKLHSTRKAAIEEHCINWHAWKTCQDFFGDRAVKVEIREVKP